MPFIKVMTSCITDQAQNTAIKTDLGQAITAIPGKSESWLMVAVDDGMNMWFKGDPAPAAMVEVSVFGSENPAAFSELTGRICDILNARLGVEKSRIYVKYSATENWGWNGANF